jgi:hypothetical protein
MRPFLLFPDPGIGTWSFLRLIYVGVPPALSERLAMASRLALFPLPAGFPSLISCEKTALLHQSLHKSPSFFIGRQELSDFAKISLYSTWVLNMNKAECYLPTCLGSFN